eukprot:5166926-Ditylum_brightwellii.AAC.1
MGGAKFSSSATWVLLATVGSAISFTHESNAGDKGIVPGPEATQLASTSLVPFANMPSQINSTVQINYSSSAGVKVWSMATEQLVMKFDCEEGLLCLFVVEIRSRA